MRLLLCTWDLGVLVVLAVMIVNGCVECYEREY